jgi:hypothetical protein
MWDPILKEETVMQAPIEYKVLITAFGQYLPKDDHLVSGGRRQDLVQVYTDPGGKRTLTLKSIVNVR